MIATLAKLTIVATAAAMVIIQPARADETQTERGKYLVTIGGCGDCHTPGYFLGQPDASRYLGGSDVGFEIPGLGVFVGPNLTPDKETGLGDWTTEQIITALQTGERPDGRVLAPIMPWHALASLTDEDVNAVVAYLQSLEPVSHAVPGPFGPGDDVTVFMMRLLPPGETAAQAPQ